MPPFFDEGTMHRLSISHTIAKQIVFKNQLFIEHFFIQIGRIYIFLNIILLGSRDLRDCAIAISFQAFGPDQLAKSLGLKKL